jgi:rRNA-processing protein FCF1
MKILLDTNFVLTCAKQKIDFPNIAEQIIDEKIEWQIPQDVINELGNLKDRKGMKRINRHAARLAFEIIEAIKPEVIQLPERNPNVDIKIVNYILGTDIVLATLDRNLKSRVNNKILTIRGKNNLELI